MMAIYTKVEKETSTYEKIDKAATGRGWFQHGWFTNWFGGRDLYKKIERALSTYTKVDK